MIDGEIRIRECLRFDALRSIDDQQRAFAGRQRPRNFVGKIHVPRRINQIQLIRLAILRHIYHPHRMRLDGDATLPLQIHRIEHLRLHLPRRQGAGQLQQPVCQRGFPMINVRDYRKVAYVLGIHRESG